MDSSSDNSKTAKRKLNTLSLEQRLIVIEQYEAGQKIVEIAKAFNIPQSTVSTIVSNKEKWLQRNRSSLANPQRKKFRAVTDSRLEEGLESFIEQAKEDNLPLTNALIRQKALQLAQQLDIQSFKASTGWLNKFAKRHNLSFSRKHSKDRPFPDTLGSLIAEYDPRDIFIAEMAGLYFKCMPDEAGKFQSETCRDGKHSEERLTMMCCANMDGSDKLPLLVVGKNCFNLVTSRQVLYETNANSWLTPKLLEKWLIGLDAKFAEEDRRIVMLVFNYSAKYLKSLQQKLHFIDLYRFPYYAMSVPNHVGIMKILKYHYRHALVRRRLEQIKEQKESGEVTLSDATNILSCAWDKDVDSDSIRNSFQTAGFPVNPANVSQKIKTVDHYNDIDMYELGASISFTSYVNVDTNVVCRDPSEDTDALESDLEEDDYGNSFIEENLEVCIGGDDVLETDDPLEDKFPNVQHTLQNMSSILSATGNVPRDIWQSFNTVEKFLNERYNKD